MENRPTAWESIDVVAGQDGYFNYPSGICLDRAHQLFYIADLHGHRVCWLKRGTWEKGELPRTIAWDHENKELDRPLGITFSPSGDLMLTDAGHNQVLLWNGNRRAWIPIPMCLEAEQVQLNLPSSVTTDPHGNIYVSDFANSRILQVAPHGQARILVGDNLPVEESGVNNGPQINKPYGIFHSDDKLYITDTENNTVRFYDLGQSRIAELLRMDEALVMAHPIAVTVDPVGNVYVCEQRRILCVEANTKRLRVVIDKDNWRDLMKQFGLQERICYTGAVVAPEEGKLFWIDTLKGLVYRMIARPQGATS